MDLTLLDVSTGNATLDAVAVASGAATPSLVIEWAVLLGVAVLFTSLRTYARARVSGLRGFKWDDYLVWMALVAYTGLTIDVYIISVSAEGLANDSISDERRAALAQDGKDSREVQLRALGSKAQLVKWLLYALVLWLLKSSLLHFFAVRLSDGIRGAKVRAWLSAALLFLTWAGTVVSVFVTCRPLKMMWQIFPNPGLICLPAVSPVLISVFLSCNIFTDLYLISLPIPLLIRAPLKKTQKLSLICLFSCNILITGIALTRAILMLKDPKHNSDGMWAVRETFVALITTNIPPIAPLLRRWMSPCFGRMDTVSDNTNAKDGGQPRVENLPRRQASRAGHNEAMANRYFSGFDSHEHFVAAGENDIKMQTYNGSSGNRKSTDDRRTARPSLIHQNHQDSPPAYREADGHVAQEVRQIV